jgi:uncharacterized membrane protein YqaE (UPF0057 family)
MMLRTLLFLACFALTGATTSLRSAVVVPVESPPTEAELLESARAYGESLKEMSAKERREIKREKRRAIKKAIREHRQDSDTNTLLLVLLTILLPFVGVAVYEGGVTSNFWITLLLTLLFYLPGLVYALLVIFG